MHILDPLHFHELSHELAAPEWRFLEPHGIPVLIVAWSLGATYAFCIMGLSKPGVLETGNYSCGWFPVSQLKTKEW